MPGGEPDGLGEDARLGDVVLEQRVAVFFPEPVRNSYQLEQWLGPLAALDERHGVAIITQDSRTTARLRAVTRLPVHCVAWTATMEDLVRRSSFGLALYVSHHPRNFQFLRWPELAHVHLGHGDSDKAVSASNQLKAYDRVFVSGQAAADRITETLMWFDQRLLVSIGRPQVSAAPAGRKRNSGPATVLYAPTWEGAQKSMSYSSVLTHGVPLVQSLLDAGLRVVYRPHPRTGANRPELSRADAAVRALFESPQATASRSAVVTEVPLGTAFADADALVTDVSSVAVEWLPTGRPLVVTVPTEPGAVLGASPLLDAVPRVTAADAAATGQLVTARLEDDVEAATRAGLVEYYLGGATGAGALDRFLDACDTVLRERDEARAVLTVAGR
jgi:hypothetical protein